MRAKRASEASANLADVIPDTLRAQQEGRQVTLRRQRELSLAVSNCSRAAMRVSREGFGRITDGNAWFAFAPDANNLA